MTTNNVDIQQLAKEAVAEAQQQTETSAAPQYMTAEQVQNILTQQQKAFERQISGLTSKIDTGLNAIRRDTRTWAEQQVQFQNQQQRKEWLDTLDESQRPIVERLLTEVDAVRRPAKEEPAAKPQATAQTDATGMWEAVYQLVEDYGLKRDNSAIDYAAFSEDGLSDRQRQQRFMASLRKASGPSAVPASPALPKPPAPPANMPAGSGSGYRNAEDVRDAFITGKLNIDEYRQRMQALGESV